MPMLCGGWSQTKDADDFTHRMVAQVKPELERKLNREFEQLSAVSYKSQIVNGTNYLIKAKASDDEHVHIRVHVPIRSEEANLVNHKDKVPPSDELEVF
uniref:Cystatin n=1 Tax=Tetranychus truncatus TaxID=93132 RepID=A0A3G5ARG4_9ACAR|nr:cystatin [Tetranychus truncatus]